MSEETSENRPLIDNLQITNSTNVQMTNSTIIRHYRDQPITRNTLQGRGYFGYRPNYSDSDDDDNDDEEDGRQFLVSGHHIDDGHPQTTDTETLIHLIKGNIGTGILAMPDALKNSGLYTGIAILPFIACICIHCMHILVNCSKEIKERTGQVSLGYADVARHAFRTSNISIFPPLAPAAKKIINIFLILTQMGFCCVYVVFITANIKQVIDCKFPTTNIDIHSYLLILFLPMLLVSMVRSLKVLAPLSLLSNFLLILGLAITFYYVLQDLPSSYDRKEFSSWEKFPLFLGTSIYAFEGIGVVLPLQKNMANPENFRGCNGVLNTAMILVTCGYIAVGFFGYLKYGDAVHGSITLNLPPGDNLAQLVKILMVCAIYLTYPLMLYVPVHITWPFIRQRFSSRGSRRLGEYAFRACLVLITFLLAAVIPNIGLFISLVGAVASAALAMIFPPIIEIVTFWPDVRRINVVKCVIFMLLGIFCFITGTYASLNSIIVYFRHYNEPKPALIC